MSLTLIPRLNIDSSPDSILFLITDTPIHVLRDKFFVFRDNLSDHFLGNSDPLTATAGCVIIVHGLSFSIRHSAAEAFSQPPAPCSLS